MADFVELENMRKQLTKQQNDISMLNQIGKNLEVLQQEIVQVRQENIVSYKMMQSLQNKQSGFEEQIEKKKMVEINEDNAAYKQLMQKFQVEIEKVRTDIVLFQ